MLSALKRTGVRALLTYGNVCLEKKMECKIVCTDPPAVQTHCLRSWEMRRALQGVKAPAGLFPLICFPVTPWWKLRVSSRLGLGFWLWTYGHPPDVLFCFLFIDIIHTQLILIICGLYICKLTYLKCICYLKVNTWDALVMCGERRVKISVTWCTHSQPRWNKRTLCFLFRPHVTRVFSV